MTTIARFLVVASILGVITGCKLEVVAVEGGDVQSFSGIRNCAEGNNCVFEVTSLPFSETFTAMPKAGYNFVEWRDSNNFRCGGQTSPSCSIVINDDAGGAAIVALFETGYVMPVYAFVGIDTDDDGVMDHLDEDDDNDGYLDVDDPYPLDPTRPIQPGSCGTTGQELVFETLDWSKPGPIKLISLARDVRSSAFRTTSGTSFAGAVNQEQTTGTGDIVRQMWISECPGGPALDQSACFDQAVGSQIRWTQSSTASRSACNLEINTDYYINYKNVNCQAATCNIWVQRQTNNNPY